MSILTRILRSDAATARYRTTALLVVSWFVTWIQTRFGLDVVGELDAIAGFGEGAIHSGLVVVVSTVLYWLSQRFAVVDEVVHLGASKSRVGGAPTYVDTTATVNAEVDPSDIIDR